jgi:hypothetical protein
MRDVPFSLVFFPTLSLFKNIGPKQEDGSPAFSSVFGSGILAGVISNCLIILGFGFWDSYAHGRD